MWSYAFSKFRKSYMPPAARILQYNSTIYFLSSLNIQNDVRLNVQYFGRFSKISWCITQQESSSPTLPQLLFSWIWLAVDWLGVDLEVMSLCYEPTPQIGNQRIEECLYSKYGRSPIGPPDVIKIILISYNVVLLKGLISQLLCLGGCFICHI